MQVKSKIFRNLYQDSVSLMQIAAQLNKLSGIEQSSVVMATEANLQQLKENGLDHDLGSVTPNDLIIAVKGEEAACDEALKQAVQQLTSKPNTDSQAVSKQPLTAIAMALEQNQEINLALISVPGDYAAAEAIKALNLGINVMLFSDNVSLEEEKQIKTLANKKNLLVMGPDCGTAIINGLPLGFANIVKKGSIGVIGASGTGLQEVTCRIDQLGEGISQALGTGGHDLHHEIGGISMLFGLSLLAEDDNTNVIVLISKPPAKEVAEKILTNAQAIKKPVVVHFLGEDKQHIAREGITYAATLADAADQAVSLSRTGVCTNFSNTLTDEDKTQLQHAASTLGKNRRYIRGVFAGGTFCYEAQLICYQNGITAASNAPIAENHKLTNIWKSEQHTLIDMGDDDFTRGKPHPMIDPSLRNQRIHDEILDKETAVVLFDLVLGYGAASDPSSELLAVIAQAKTNSSMPIFIAHVCGTEQDIQIRSQQINALKQAGVLVANCNAQAALWASYVVTCLAK